MDTQPGAQRHGSRERLSQQLLPGAKVQQVVGRAEDRDDKTTDEDAEQLQIGQRHKRHGQHEARDDRKTAHARHGACVDPPRTRLIHGADGPGKAPHPRRQGKGRQRGGNSGDDKAERKGERGQHGGSSSGADR